MRTYLSVKLLSAGWSAFTQPHHAAIAASRSPFSLRRVHFRQQVEIEGCLPDRRRWCKSRWFGTLWQSYLPHVARSSFSGSWVGFVRDFLHMKKADPKAAC